MKIVKWLFSFGLIISLFFSALFFVGCKNNDTKYIDLDKSHSLFKKYTYDFNVFFDVIYEKNATHQYKNQLDWFKNNEYNEQFEAIISAMKIIETSKDLKDVDGEIEKDENKYKLNSLNSYTLLESNSEYNKLKVSMSSKNNLMIYEVVKHSEISYHSQLIQKIDNKYIIYQFVFVGTSGKVAVLQNVSEYSSIFDNEVGDKFASESHSNYYFD